MKRTLLLVIGLWVLLGVGGVVWLKAHPLQQGSVQTATPLTAMHPSTTPDVQPSRAILPPVAMQATTTPTIGPVSATPSLITVNTSTQVLITAQITDPTVIPNGVNLLRVGATGAPSTILGVMHDDGLNGDAVANDNTFSLQVSFNETTAGQIELQVTAAFRGVLKRILSPPVLIDVWNTIVGGAPSRLFTTVSPPSWTSETLPINVANLGAAGVAISSADDDEGDNGITVESAPGTMADSVGDLNTRFSLLSDTSLMINDVSWRILVHLESDSNQRFITALTERTGTVYSIGAKDIGNNASIIHTMMSNFVF
jgi:hypothetical protein